MKSIQKSIQLMDINKVMCNINIKENDINCA